MPYLKNPLQLKRSTTPTAIAFSGEKYAISLKRGKAELEIRNPQPQDAGKYRCIITNPLGEDETEAKLTITCTYAASDETFIKNARVYTATCTYTDSQASYKSHCVHSLLRSRGYPFL